MAPFEWSASLETGIRQIDEDHQKLFEVVNRLESQVAAGTGEKKISATIESLRLYVEEHFYREERYMKTVGYPGFEQHRRSHVHLCGLILCLRDIHREQPECVDADKVLQFLEEWLLAHVMKQDMDYVPYLTGDALPSAPPPETTDETVSVTVPSERNLLIRQVACALREGGTTAQVLEEAINDVIGGKSRRLREEARVLFCA